MNSIKRRFGKKHEDETSYRMNNEVLQTELSEEKATKYLLNSLPKPKTINCSYIRKSEVKQINHNIDIGNYSAGLTKSKNFNITPNYNKGKSKIIGNSQLIFNHKCKINLHLDL